MSIMNCHKKYRSQETYRDEARTDNLKYAKAKRLTAKTRRTSLRQQLQDIKRNIETIETRVQCGFFALNEDQTIELST